MKRILAVMMAVLLMMSIVGCGKSDGGGVELFEKEDPRKDLIVGEWYAGNEESDEPDIVFNEDGSVTSPSYEEGTDSKWEFEDGYLIMTNTAIGETTEQAVLYIDEYEMDFVDNIHFFKEPTSERISQYSTRIVGTWYTANSEFMSNDYYYALSDIESQSFIVFKEDSTFENMMGETGTWSVNNDVLNLFFADGHSDEWELISVTDNKISFDNDFYYEIYSKSILERKDEYKNVQPIICEGKYEGYFSSMEFSNIKGRKCDMTFSIENADGSSKTISGKGEFWSIGYNDSILNFTPDGSNTVVNAGIYNKYSIFVSNLSFFLWKNITDNEQIGGYFSPQSIIIPKEMKRISERFFEYYDDLTDITLSEGIKSIGSEAFYGCLNLKSITIPTSITLIGEDAFDNCPNLTIHAPLGSYAEQYAKENNIPFEAE